MPKQTHCKLTFHKCIYIYIHAFMKCKTYKISKIENSDEPHCIHNSLGQSPEDAALTQSVAAKPDVALSVIALTKL